MKKIKLQTQEIHLSAVGKIVIPISKKSDDAALAHIFNEFGGFDAIRTFEAFDAKAGNVWRVLHETGELFLLGMGNDLNQSAAYKIFRKFCTSYKNELDAELGVFIHHITLGERKGDENTLSVFGLAEISVMGLVAGTNQLKLRSDDIKDHPLEQLILLTRNEHEKDREYSDRILSHAKKGRILAESQLNAMQLINIPSNWKNPLQFVDLIQDSSKLHGYHCEIFDDAQLKDEGFDALLAVNRGSEYPARFAVLQYDGTQDANSNPPLVALVGKGVTHDTGGLSIKPSESMYHMKCDMGGAATVLAVTEAVTRLKLPIRLLTVIPLTDNLIDARSIKPGDIIGSYSGKSIEIVDTDAEGRLILADAISWVIKNANPDHIIDVATLTGATVRTFGSHASALFCKNEELSKILIQCSEKTGERIWPLPLWDDYLDEIKSDVADIRNLGSKPTAGAITAAKFLEYFTESHPSWAHLDVAGTIYGDTEFGKQKNATGYGVRLLVESIISISDSGNS